MKNIFKDLKSLEIIRNIIRETLMGNAALALIIAVAVHFAEKQFDILPALKDGDSYSVQTEA